MIIYNYRRLNSKSKDAPHHEHNFITEKKEDVEMEEQMWRYPYRRIDVPDQHFSTVGSQDSVDSSVRRGLPPVHREKRYDYF